MSKLNEARMASLNDKIYDSEVEQEKKRARKPKKRLKTKRGSSRTSRVKRKKKGK